MGVKCPRISLIHCSEKADERHFPYTAGYAAVKKASQEDVFGDCIVDGPLDVTTSVSKEALDIKGLKSPLEGHADGLVFPDIEAGNVFYKTITFFAHARVASVLQGTMAPVVLPSRGDSNEAKFFSIALAAL
jgi:phosphate butyryltransferase